MKARLISGVVLVEITLLALLLFLLRQPGLPGTVPLILVFLLPIAYGLHLVEEVALPGGFF